MENSTEKWISVFVSLGDRLADFGHDTCSQEIIAAAVAANPWFSYEDIVFAAGALATGWTVRGSNPGGGEIFRTVIRAPKKSRS